MEDPTSSIAAACAVAMEPPALEMKIAKACLVDQLSTTRAMFVTAMGQRALKEPSVRMALWTVMESAMAQLLWIHAMCVAATARLVAIVTWTAKALAAGARWLTLATCAADMDLLALTENFVQLEPLTAPASATDRTRRTRAACAMGTTRAALKTLAAEKLTARARAMAQRKRTRAASVEEMAQLARRLASVTLALSAAMESATVGLFTTSAVFATVADPVAANLMLTATVFAAVALSWTPVTFVMATARLVPKTSAQMAQSTVTESVMVPALWTHVTSVAATELLAFSATAEPLIAPAIVTARLSMTPVISVAATDPVASLVFATMERWIVRGLAMGRPLKILAKFAVAMVPHAAVHIVPMELWDVTVNAIAGLFMMIAVCAVVIVRLAVCRWTVLEIATARP